MKYKLLRWLLFELIDRRRFFGLTDVFIILREAWSKHYPEENLYEVDTYFQKALNQSGTANRSLKVELITIYNNANERCTFEVFAVRFVLKIRTPFKEGEPSSEIINVCHAFANNLDDGVVRYGIHEVIDVMMPANFNNQYGTIIEQYQKNHGTPVTYYY